MWPPSVVGDRYAALSRQTPSDRPVTIRRPRPPSIGTGSGGSGALRIVTALSCGWRSVRDARRSGGGGHPERAVGGRVQAICVALGQPSSTLYVRNREAATRRRPCLRLATQRVPYASRACRRRLLAARSTCVAPHHRSPPTARQVQSSLPLREAASRVRHSGCGSTCTLSALRRNDRARVLRRTPPLAAVASARCSSA